MTQQEKALKLLATGLQPTVVASAVGVTKGAVSQWMQEPAFVTKLAEQQAMLNTGAIERDAAYDDIESLLLDKLKTNVPLMFKTQEILGAIRIINAAKRRSITNPDKNGTVPQIIKLCLPAHVTAKFTMNAQGVVVEVAGRELTTIDSGALLKQVNKHKKPALQTGTDVSDAVVVTEGNRNETRNTARGSTQLPAETGAFNI